MLDHAYVPMPRSDVRLVAVGDEAVLVDRWNLALVLNPTGAMIWRRFDGCRPIRDVAGELAEETGAACEEVTLDVVRFVERMGVDGFLAGYVSPPLDDDDELELQFVPVMPVGEGSIVAATDGVDDAGRPSALIDSAGGQRLLVTWNPHCGFCAGIARTLVDLRPGLATAGIDLLLVCVGDVDERRRSVGVAAQNAGVALPAWFAPDALDPFPAVGTPSAYHVDGDGRVVSLPAHGAEEVPAKAARLAGVQLDVGSDSGGTTVRYLRGRGGMCAPDMAALPGEWSANRVYRIEGYHVGVRVDTENTANVLDQLFPGARVRDDRAGHSYSIALPGAAKLNKAESPDHSAGSVPLGSSANSEADGIGTLDPDGLAAGPRVSAGLRALNLFSVSGKNEMVRTRDPARVLRAFLSQLDDDLVEHELPAGLVRVTARAVVIDGEAALLPSAADSFQPHLQSVLARMGVALVDIARPVIDLTTGSLVVESPMVAHAEELVTSASLDLTSSRLERPVVNPGRYPLRFWCVLQPGKSGVTGLTPAEAAAATVSSIVDTVDPAARVRQLGALFASGRPRGLGLWYESEPSFFAAVEAAVNWSPSLAVDS